MAETGNKILSSELSGFIPGAVANEIVASVTRGSAIMRLGKAVDMQGKTKKKVPVLVSGPGAFWVSESERIQTSKAQWIFPELEAKKLAVIIPMSKESLNDSSIDVFNSLKPYIAESFAVAFDKAGLWGTSSPYAAGSSIYEKAVAAGNSFENQSIATQDMGCDISDTMSLVEADGYDVNGFVSAIGIKNSLRKLRNKDGDPIFSDMKADTPAQVYGQPLAYSRNGGWDSTKALLVAGSWDYALFGVLQDVEYEILKEATLLSVTMADDKPLSLAENDMIALKATMRIGFLDVKDSAFSILTPKAGG